MIFSALLATFIQVLLTLIALSTVAAIALLLFILGEEAYERISSRLRARRCWKEIETAQRQLELDEAVGRPRLGVSQREHVVRERAS